MDEEGTIFALASGAGAAGIAVFRISGPAAAAAIASLTGRPPPTPRLAAMRDIRDPGGEVIDRGLLLWFPGPASFTGEDVAELHLHGGRAVRDALHATLSALDLRPAEAGEFTRRAFRNGKLDLTQAEGLADLVAAETDGQRRQALRQMSGALGARYERWRGELVECLAMLEAVIDFPDEDLPEGVDGTVVARLAALADGLRRHLADGRRGERLREGVQVAIIGAPNVGKSSLLNALSRRDLAIVTDRAGTTRDVVEAALDLGGIPVVLADTAGLRDSADPIEREGIRRAWQRAEQADIRLLLLDATMPAALPEGLAALPEGRLIVAANKIDLVVWPPDSGLVGEPVLGLSVRDGTGMEALLARLTSAAEACAAPMAEAGITRLRHREAVEDCLRALERGLGQAGEGCAAAPELVAEDVRLAVRALGRITGSVDVEEVLGQVFARFCIGK